MRLVALMSMCFFSKNGACILETTKELFRTGITAIYLYCLNFLFIRKSLLYIITKIIFAIIIPHHNLSDMKLSNNQDFLNPERTIADEIRDTHKAQADLWQGVSAFSAIKNCVTVYGSARFREGDKYYELARAMGKELAKHKFTVMTGGGPGVMEAANRGAKEGGGLSLGCNIILPFEQAPNLYVDRMVSFEFFFTRKVILRKNSVAYVLMPGGFGTMDEIFEVLTLIQTHKLPPRPVVCLGKEYWKHLGTFIRETMIEMKTISMDDLDLMMVTDDPVEAVAYISKNLVKGSATQTEVAEE